MTEKFVPSLEAYHALTQLSEVEFLQRKIKQLEDRACKLNWQLYPDRSGGAFSQDEIDNATAWR